MRNQYAKALANPVLKQRIVRARKGKGSYKRNDKNHKNSQA
jgi:stalled ribosome alternative rescue factor ArfA